MQIKKIFSDLGYLIVYNWYLLYILNLYLLYGSFLKFGGGYLNEMEKFFGDKGQIVFIVFGKRFCFNIIVYICEKYIDKN